MLASFAVLIVGHLAISSMTTYSLPSGAVVSVSTTPGKPVAGREGEVWSCPDVRTNVRNIYGTSVKEHFSAGPSGITFSDPDDAKNDGSCTFSGVQKQYHVGDKVTISLSASKMLLTCNTRNCADGKRLLQRGVMDPFNPPRSTQTFSFTFQPPEGADRATISMEASPTMSKNYNGWTATSTWVFTPGNKPAASLDLKISDITKTGGDVSYLTRGNGIADVEKLFSNAMQVDGVAADGVSALLVTTTSDSPGDVTFSIDGAGGALYPVKSSHSIFKLDGSSTCTDTLRKVGHGYGGVAMYRPPSYFGRGENPKKVTFHVRGSDGEDHAKTINLVRPPVVLVHGTYDNPAFCYEQHDEEDDSPIAMAPMLRRLGYDVSSTDWEKTNGDKDPSDFQTNRMTVWRNKDGIKDALKKMRDRNIAVTQADVVCHSQGGVIARTYIRGFPFSVPMSPDAKHYTDPDHCKIGDTDCWYHREDNFYQGDIHRLITISTTHRGSHVCNVFPALDKYSDSSVATISGKFFTNVFLVGVDKGVTGVTTGGFYNQVPDSLELQLIGPSPVPSHGIACVATDEDMKTVRINHRGGVTLNMGDYYGKLFLIWSKVPNDAKEFAFGNMVQKAIGRGVVNAQQLFDDYHRTLADYQKVAGGSLPDHTNDSSINAAQQLTARDANIYAIRQLVFEGDENDCTVAMHSSWGLLKAPYTPRCDHVLHGWAPRYRNVQNKVIELLVNDGSLFDANGFPGYTGIQSRASTFTTMIRPTQDSGAVPTTGGDSGRHAGPSTNTGGLPGRTSIDPNTGSRTMSRKTPPGMPTPTISISPSTWSVPPSPISGGRVRFDGGAMTISLGDGENGRPQGFANPSLVGDFDVSFDIDVTSDAGSPGLRLLSLSFRTNPADEEREVLLTREDNVGRLNMRFMTPESGVTSRPTFGSKTRLRMQRVGNTWKAYEFTGGGWQLIAERPGPVEPVHPGFIMQRLGQPKSMKAVIHPVTGSRE